ncbi:hypothetical protein BJY21_001859 [Kineosphaera limosa]|uniref:SIMPL domain-containing protein n=1 Tax=Kineosphaera limosa NBRC 100340 TaxID=1184609 RepID=K6XD67_9MICO|nr:SIMPL domain-containing protein [Kineosphaera limosa]NYE00675.1 hypothetical protein [Kineosphaera limosa]GAB96764.1 hypothetical protein KILIM_048_00020 [Kineosphaera limosa NBRC 100340]
MEITVTGTARASVPPERATLALRAAIESTDKPAALAQASALVRDLSARLRALEAADPAPTTQVVVLPLSVQSHRSYTPAGQEGEWRHTASASLRVTFADLPALAGFVDDVGGLEGVAIDQVEWALTVPTRERVEAAVLTEAVSRARARATTIAHAAGALDLQFAQIADPGLLDKAPAEPEARYALMAHSASDRGGIDLAPEDIVVESTLHVRFIAT